MEFGNPIVGGEDLIRTAIKSPDFNTDPESGNVTGWRIARDGSATFYNLTIGSTSFNIDENGNAVFQNVTVNDLIIGGQSLTDTLASLPRGIISINAITNSGTYDNVNDFALGQIVIPNYDPTRAYRVGWIGRIDMAVAAGVNATTYMSFEMYYKWDAAATGSDTRFMNQQFVRRNPSSAADSGYDLAVNMQTPLLLSSAAGTDLNISVLGSGNVAGFKLQTGSGINCWLWVEDIGPYIAPGSWSPGTPPTQQYVKTYAANESASYQSDGSNRGISDCYQGYYSGTNGNQFSMIGFDDTQIRIDTAGSTINKVELYLNNNHFYANAGGNAVIGMHNQTNLSGTHSSSQITDNLQQTHFDLGQAKWITIPTSIGNALKGNTAKGIALGPGPTNSQNYYAYFAGNGQSGEPQLRITYTK